MTEDVPDPLNAFHGMASCPVCGCLSLKGALRCPECGTFHAGHVLEERTPPSPEEREAGAQRAIEPSMYSLGPSSTAPDESFEESDALTQWTGGSTDFSFDEDEDDRPLKQSMMIPEAETVASNEDES